MSKSWVAALGRALALGILRPLVSGACGLSSNTLSTCSGVSRYNLQACLQSLLSRKRCEPRRPLAVALLAPVTIDFGSTTKALINLVLKFNSQDLIVPVLCCGLDACIHARVHFIESPQKCMFSCLSCGATDNDLLHLACCQSCYRRTTALQPTIRLFQLGHDVHLAHASWAAGHERS